MPSRRIRLKNNLTGELVWATLHDQLTERQLLEAELAWAPRRAELIRELLRAGVPLEKLPRHGHWDWTRKIGRLKSPLVVFYGIECDGDDAQCEEMEGMQGLMVVYRDGYRAHLSSQQDKPLIYVDYIEIAPWNVRDLTRTPFYSGLGVNLFRAVIELSLQEDYHGRVGLHSLPGSPERFYQDACLMTPVGRDESKEDLMYFELTSENARKFLGGEG